MAEIEFNSFQTSFYCRITSYYQNFFITYIKTKIKLNERNFKGKYERIYSYNQQEQPDERNYFNQINFGGKIFMLS